MRGQVDTVQIESGFAGRLPQAAPARTPRSTPARSAASTTRSRG